MRKHRPSETALKVALTMVTLAEKPGWSDRLPSGIAELSEQLILSAEAWGYNASLMKLSKRQLMVQFYEIYERIMPGIFEGLGERKIFVDDQVRGALDEGFEQVLIVGAGFDTLTLRLAPHYKAVRFFEVDHPATGQAKMHGVTKIGQPSNLFMRQANLGEEKLSAVLEQTPEWQGDKRSVVVLEGLLYYLRAEDVLDVFSEVRTSTGVGSRAVFSHVLNHKQISWAAPLLRMIGEPWLSSATIAALPEYIGEGWRISLTREISQGNQFESLAVAESLSG